MVSTHSRLKAAGDALEKKRSAIENVSTHSRLKAAGDVYVRLCYSLDVSTHSRLKAAGGNAWG